MLAAPTKEKAVSIEQREREDIRVRDMFAAAALQGAMSASRGMGELEKDELRLYLDQVAEICYDAADAMMRKRNGES